MIDNKREAEALAKLFRRASSVLVDVADKRAALGRDIIELIAEALEEKAERMAATV